MKTFQVTYTMFQGPRVTVVVRAPSILEAHVVWRPEGVISGTAVMEVPDHYYKEPTK